MQKLPASVGRLWIKEGVALFRKQPAELSILFLSYLFLMIIVGNIPFVGQILRVLLIPVFSMAFLQACVNIEQGKRVYPVLLLTGFRSPSFPTLLKLGIFYVVAAVIAIGLSSIVDDGVFWQATTGQITPDEKMIAESNMAMAMLFFAAAYALITLPFWYAAPLIAWQNMGVSKSIFYSFFSVRHAGKAFLAYIVAWVMIGIALVMISAMAALVTGKSEAMKIILFPASMIMTIVMYCSFYSTYTHVFGKPAEISRA